MPRESEYLTVMRISNPKSIRLRLRRAPLISLATLTIFVPLLGLLVSALSDNASPSFPNWLFGASLWLLTLLLVPVYFRLARRIQRAAVAYALIWAAMLPGGLGILDGALRLATVLLGERPLILIGFGFFIGLATLPLAVRQQRKQRYIAMKEGHLTGALDREHATWDPQYDYDATFSKDWLTRPGCFIRVLPWIGPIIGMRLADVFGQSTANIVMVGAGLSVGYVLVYFTLLRLAVDLLEFRELESELGRAIGLAADPRGA